MCGLTAWPVGRGGREGPLSTPLIIWPLDSFWMVSTTCWAPLNDHCVLGLGLDESLGLDIEGGRRPTLFLNFHPKVPKTYVFCILALTRTRKKEDTRQQTSTSSASSAVQDMHVASFVSV